MSPRTAMRRGTALLQVLAVACLAWFTLVSTAQRSIDRLVFENADVDLSVADAESPEAPDGETPPSEADGEPGGDGSPSELAALPRQSGATMPLVAVEVAASTDAPLPTSDGHEQSPDTREHPPTGPPTA